MLTIDLLWWGPAVPPWAFGDTSRLPLIGVSQAIVPSELETR